VKRIVGRVCVITRCGSASWLRTHGTHWYIYMFIRYPDMIIPVDVIVAVEAGVQDVLSRQAYQSSAIKDTFRVSLLSRSSCSESLLQT
jgi:hypothetical protein